MRLRELASAVAPWRYPRRDEDGAEHAFVAELEVCAGLGDLRRRICHEISDRFSARHTVIFETTDGGTTYRALSPIDVRIIAATNRDLQAEVSAGRFRGDLYWRLSQFPVHLPALRERREDLPLLVGHFVRAFNTQFSKRVEGVSSSVTGWMQQHEWPGNVRELATVIRWGVLIAEGPLIADQDLHGLPSYTPAPHAEAAEGPVQPLKDTLKRTLEQVERTAIEAAMTAHQGRRTHVAAALGLSRRALFNKLRQYGLDKR